jgi:hypothetical protein
MSHPTAALEDRPRLIVTGVEDTLGGNLALSLSERFSVLGLHHRRAISLDGCRTAVWQPDDAADWKATICRESPCWIVHCGPLARSSWEVLAEILDGTREGRLWVVLVGNLRRREFPFTVSTTGRVFNSITGLKRELRAEVRIDGERVGGVDIRCAQPALLALAMFQETPANGLEVPATYKHTDRVPLALSPACPAPCPAFSPAPDFSSLVFGGRLYGLLMDRTGLDRDLVKLAFLRDVLAKRGRYPSTVEQAFRAAFPAVYRYIRKVNYKDHGELIRHL